MEAWLVALAVVALAIVALLLVRIRVRLSLQGRGDPSGSWALAGGAQIGPLALSGVAATGLEPTFAAHLLGKKIWSKRLSELGEKHERDHEGDSDEPSLQRARRLLAEQRDRYRKLERWFDPVDLVVFVVQERRRLSVEELEANVGYSFADIALTGKITAALYMLGGALPAPFVIRPDPSWEAEDRADLAVSSAIVVRPGLALVDTALFVVRRVRLRKRPPTSGPTEAK